MKRDSTYMRNVNVADDPAKAHELNNITNRNAFEQEEGSDVENVLGSVHISKPSINHAFFLLKPLLNPVLKQVLKVQTDLDELVNTMRLERVFIDKPFNISTNIPYTVDYKQRKFLYLMCMQALTLVVNGNTITTNPGQWTPIDFPIGTKIYALGISDAAPMPVTIRASDVLLALAAASLGNVGLNAGANNIGNVGIVGTVITEDQIRSLIANGQGFRATTTLIATGAANAFVGLQARALNLGVNVVIYNVLCVSANNNADGRIYYNTTGANLDAGLTTNLLTANTSNQIVGAANPQLSVLNGSPPATAETTGMGGTGAIQTGLFNGMQAVATPVLQNGSQIWLPKNTDQNFSLYTRVVTSGNTLGFMIEWVELA